MAIKYGLLKNSVMTPGMAQFPAGSWIRFDGSDPFWAGVVANGSFNTPIEEQGSLPEGFSTVSSIRSDEPLKGDLIDATVAVVDKPKIIKKVGGKSVFTDQLSEPNGGNQDA